MHCSCFRLMKSKQYAVNEKAEKTAYEYPLEHGSIALIMGSEDKEDSKGLLKVTDDTVKLPMSEQMDSLNV